MSILSESLYGSHDQSIKRYIAAVVDDNFVGHVVVAAVVNVGGVGDAVGVLLLLTMMIVDEKLKCFPHIVVIHFVLLDPTVMVLYSVAS